jgi:hypothetical protein
MNGPNIIKLRSKNFRILPKIKKTAIKNINKVSKKIGTSDHNFQTFELFVHM